MLPKPNDIVDGRYRVDSEIGRGGFATVFLATDLKKRTQVALKVMDVSYGTDPVARRRFEREARILRKLRSPHIVQLLDHGLTDPPHLVFELLGGEDLARRLASQQRLTAEETKRVLRQLLDALSAAHSAGILHRDIKPENVRIWGSGPEARIKLFDFGIARPTDDGSPGLTLTGELIGTPRYMSPEQLTGLPLTVASDIYSAGLLAFEMLLGRDALHGGGWYDQLDRLRSGHVFTLPGLNDEGVALIGILRRMTARDPGDRFGSAQAVIYALDTDDASPTDVVDPDEQPPPRWWPALLTLALLGFIAAAWLISNHTTAPEPLERLERRGQNGSALLKPEPTRVMPDVSAAVVVQDSGPAAPLSGCGQPVPVNAAGYTPRDYDSSHPHPVVIVLRDQYMSAQGLLTKGGFAQLADRERLIVLTPEPEDLVLAPQLWRDVHETSRLVVGQLRQAMSDFCVDPGRIFVVGVGGGGGPARRLSCLPWIAGVATWAHNTDKIWCDEPKPFLLLYPTKSKHQRIDDSTPRDEVCERVVRKYYVDHVEDWQKRNQCTGRPRKRAAAGANCVEFDCEAPFVACQVDGGRSWPGVTRSKPFEVLGFVNEPLSCDGPTTTEFDPIDALWNFFVALPNTPRDLLEPGTANFLE